MKENLDRIHRGAIVKEAVERSGVSITALAKKLETSRKTIYTYFENENLLLETVVEIGVKINHDFKSEIPEVAYYVGNNIHNLNEPEGVYETAVSRKLNDCIEDRDFWKSSAYETAQAFSRFKDIFYQLAIEAAKNGTNTDVYLERANQVGSIRQ